MDYFSFCILSIDYIPSLVKKDFMGYFLLSLKTLNHATLLHADFVFWYTKNGQKFLIYKAYEVSGFWRKKAS